MIPVRFRSKVFSALSVLLILTATGCSGRASTIKAETVWARAATVISAENQSGNGSMHSKAGSSMGSMPGDASKGPTSAIYMVLTNSRKESDALLAVRTDVAEKVELHRTTITNDVMRMEPVERIEIPAGGQVELKRGGLHVMLLGLKRDLKAGDTFKAVLVLSKAGEVSVDVEVRDP